MGDGFTTMSHTIFNHKIFCDLSKSFDERFDTKTYIGYDTLINLRRKFPMLSEKTKNRPAYMEIHSRILHNIDKLFTNHHRTEARSEDYMVRDTKESPRPYELHFFNSVYRFLIDIRAGKGLYGPLSISRFKNNHCQIHPGSHRLAMCHVYHEPMMYVLTDYNINRDLVKTKKFGELHYPEDVDYDWRRGRWNLREMNYNHVYWQSTQREKKYKDIIDQMMNDEEHSFHKPELAERHYVLDGDKVLVNDMPVCELVDNKWRIVCV